MKNPQVPQPNPYIWYGFCLTPHFPRVTIPRILLLRLRLCLPARPLGEAHAIFAGLDRAMYQSGLRRARSLVARSSFRSQRGFGILPFVRKHLAGGSPTHRPAPAHEAARSRRAPAYPPSSAVTGGFCGVHRWPWGISSFL